MSDITGIIAKIKMTEQAKSKMYEEIGKELLTDHFLIQKAFNNALAYQLEMDKIVAIQSSNNPMSIDEYMQAKNLLNQKYFSEQINCDPEDMLFIRYDKETESLFYFHMFRWNGTENLKTSISLQIFLGQISKYKDIDVEDFIFFSDCATDLLRSQFFKIWSVVPNKTKELELIDWNIDWNKPLEEADLLSKKYYFNIVDKYYTFNEAEGYWSSDEEGLNKELNDNWVDRELINLI